MKKKAAHFWNWFLQHENKLSHLLQLDRKEQKHYFFWLNWHLQFYFPGLEGILVFPKKNKKKKTELIITATGKQELFRSAVELEKKAPRLKNWKFTALIQPRKDTDDLEAGLDEPYVFQDITLKASELKFIPFQYDGVKKIDMLVYMKNYTVYADNKNLSTLINMMLQDLLGEKILAENINFVQLAQLPKNEDDEMIYLYDLQYYLDDINKSF